MIKLVRVDQDYIKELRKVDNNVQINSTEMNKETKPFLGVLFQVDWMEYFVPLSSPKAKHNNMSNTIDFHKIYGENGKLRAVLNFNNMVPVVPALYEVIDINNDKDKYVLLEEYRYCKGKEELLRKKAELYYQKFCNNHLTPSQKGRTCNFLKLEQVLIKKMEAKTKEKIETHKHSK